MDKAKIEAGALRNAANELPGWMPGRARVSDWLWARAADIERAAGEVTADAR